MCVRVRGNHMFLAHSSGHPNHRNYDLSSGLVGWCVLIAKHDKCVDNYKHFLSLAGARIIS